MQKIETNAFNYNDLLESQNQETRNKRKYMNLYNQEMRNKRKYNNSYSQETRNRDWGAVKTIYYTNYDHVKAKEDLRITNDYIKDKKRNTFLRDKHGLSGVKPLKKGAM